MEVVMNRRTFLKNIAYMGAGLALAPFALPKASAAWSTGASSRLGLPIAATNLMFRYLENREVTDAIIIHHVGNTNADVSAARMHEWHLANGWAGLGYHFVIRKDGTIEAGRPMDTVGAHCQGENDHTVGINIVGNFMEAEPETVQLMSAARLIAALGREYRIVPGADTVFGHRDFNATLCPGDTLYARLPDIIERAKIIYDS